MTLPIRSLLGGVLTLGAAGSAFAGRLDAQTAAADSGTFVIRHAADTIGIERFERTATTLKGTLALRSAKGTAQVYEAVVAPDASVALIEVTVQQTPDSGQTKGRVVQRARVIFKEDSAAVDDVTNHGLQTRVFGTERGAVPYLNLSFALLEQAIRRSRAVESSRCRSSIWAAGRRWTARCHRSARTRWRSPSGASSSICAWTTPGGCSARASRLRKWWRSESEAESPRPGRDLRLASGS